MSERQGSSERVRRRAAAHATQRTIVATQASACGSHRRTVWSHEAEQMRLPASLLPGGKGGGEERMTTWPWPLSSPTQLRHCMVSQHCRWSQRTHSHTTIQCTTAHAFVRGDGRPPLNQWPAELFLPLDASP